MLIAVVAKMRNGLLLRYRKERGLTQKDAAEQAEVPATSWNAIETMRFRDVSWKWITTVANFLEVSANDICPEVLRKKNLRLEATAYRECQAHLLEAQQAENRLTLPSPRDVIESEELRSMQKVGIEQVLKTLTYREREIIKLRYGIGDGCTYTLEECGRIFKISRERVREVEAKAIRKLQRPSRSLNLEAAAGIERSPGMVAVAEFFERGL